jgi:tRNA-specific 2-thiouridylase
MRRLAGARRRVVVAMSGGVDSSTVAGLLVEAGHEVIGVMMKLYDQSSGRELDGDAAGGVDGSDGWVANDPGSAQQCCGLDDVGDARRVADHLGIPFYVGNYVDAFTKGVVEPFVDAYVQGRTPNPCVRCNDTVKFKTLLKRSRMLGADFLATGHYVRTDVAPDGRVSLHRGVDADKDQSYFVAGIDRGALERVVFPLGGLSKAEVRAHAERLGLPVADKAESQEICFVPNDDYAAFVEGRAGGRLAGGGDIVSLDGLRLGRHRGLHRYTVGQRRGLGVATGRPTYVVDLDTEANRLVVGDRADVLATGLHASGERWLAESPAPGQRCVARIRHRHAGVEAVVQRSEGGRLEVHFEVGVAAVTPGQQVVLYEGDRVLGAATIDGALTVHASTSRSGYVDPASGPRH